jgi:two-component system chemotaxis response regulator CheY
MKFLVVDDSRLARSMMREYIENIGFEVVAEGSNGLEAIEKFHTVLPDIMTIDLEMPQLNGIDAAKEILKSHPEASIILITSIIAKKEVLRALKIGIKQVIAKPFTQEEFTLAIEELNTGGQK